MSAARRDPAELVDLWAELGGPPTTGEMFDAALTIPRRAATAAPPAPSAAAAPNFAWLRGAAPAYSLAAQLLPWIVRAVATAVGLGGVVAIVVNAAAANGGAVAAGVCALLIPFAAFVVPDYLDRRAEAAR